MKCPKCNFLTNEKKCRKCGENIYIVNKMLKVSYRLYNEGLEKANKLDYYKAVVCLKKSIYFNKENVEVRNLLGLLYYHIGHFSDAIKHWIISTNIDDSENNIAFYYIETFNKNIRKFDKLNRSIKLYNKALRDIKNGNDDLAIIGLKKAISINKNFIDALNLLALCYIMQKKYKNALIYLERSVHIDNKNDVSNNYIEYIKSKSNKNKKEQKKTKKDEDNENKVLIIEERYNEKKTTIKNVYSFVFGAILVVAVLYYLILPDYLEKNNQKVDSLNTIIKQEEQVNKKLEEENAKNKGAIESLQKENLEVKKQLQLQIDKLNLNINIQKLNQAKELYKKWKIDDTKKIIQEINIKGFTKEQLEEYEYIKKKVIK